jgi:cell division protein FtsW (lipid II flippase)
MVVAGIRTLISAMLLACAAVYALLVLSLNGYREDDGSPPLHTLWLAIPWTVATIVLAVLVLGSIVDRKRRERWSWLALGLGGAMAIVLFAGSALG